jgi:hypothetical protein
MALAYLIDENLRGVLMLALVRTATRYGLTLDVVQVGDADAPPRGTPDPDLLVWAEANSRILVSHDRRTMPGHLAQHLGAGRRSPGVFQLRHGRLVDWLMCRVVVEARKAHRAAMGTHGSAVGFPGHQ